MIAWTDCMLRTLPRLITAVRMENERQLGKWGLQTHSPAEWSAIIAEEEGELAKELCEANWRTPDRVAIRAEAIQVATLALKIAEMCDQ